MARVFILLAFYLSTANSQGLDPCSSYTLVQQPRRNVSYTKTVDLCDRLISTGWYRFKDAEMPFDKCVSQYHCGTHIPLWIQGTYPSVTDGMVIRKACGDMTPNNNNCCEYEIEVAVKNCQSYFVYYLQPVQGCSMAYCTDNPPKCTGAEYSKTGWPPCTSAYPILTQAPTLSNPIVTPTDYMFSCHIPYPPNRHDAIFDVTWLINGRTSIHTESLAGGQRDATISGAALEGYLNSALSCSVVTSFVDNHTGGQKSPPAKSNSYWAGVKYSSSVVTLTQTSPNHKVSLTSTIPIVCRSSAQKDCSITFQLNADNENISPSTCLVTLKRTDWNPVTSTATTSFQINTKPSIPLTPSSHSTIHIAVATNPGREWNNYQLPYIWVHVSANKPGAHCSSVGDPHYRTFDNNQKIFNNFHVGQYTLVRQKRGTFKVETRTWSHPGGKASFNCGVVAREGNDVIEVDMCHGRWGQTYPKLEIKNPSMFENKTEIVKDHSGNHFVLKFQSGAVVKVNKGRLSFLNVFVYVPGTFMQNTEGLCGTFDGNSGNDYTRSSGHIDSFQLFPYSFIESWRIPHGTSLFEKAEPLSVTTTKQNYCACTSQTTNQQCNHTSTQPSITNLCTACNPVFPIPGPLQSPTATPGSTSTQAPPIVSHKTYNFPPPTQPPQVVPFISRPDATRYCTDLLDKYPSAKKCIHNMFQLEFTEIITMCTTDIELTGDKDMGLSALSTLMDGCGFKALTDPKNIVNGIFVMPTDAKVCPGACTGNGDCQNGICVCDPGFEGSDCSVNATQPPLLRQIAGGSACDLLSHDCYRPIMLGENMKENATKCNIRHIHYSEFGSSTMDQTVTQVSAVFMSTYHVTCPLPKGGQDYDNYALHGYMVSLTSNGGVSNSNEYMYSVYNSKCMNCDDQGSCTVKHDACMIENNCYGSGDRDARDNQGWCVPTVSNTKWNKQAPPLTVVPTTAAPITLPSSTIPTQGTANNHYTAVGTGCGCYFEPSRSDCACCKNYGCPCDASNMHVCYDCMNPAMCNSRP